MKLTPSGKLILRLLATEPDRTDWYGLLVANTLNLSMGTVYPALARLETDGLIVRREETGRTSGRPRRVYYAIAPSRLDEVRSLVETLPAPPTF